MKNRKLKLLKTTIAMFLFMIFFAIAGKTAEAATVTDLKQTSAGNDSIMISFTGVPGSFWYNVQLSKDDKFSETSILYESDFTMPQLNNIISWDLASGETYYIRVGHGRKITECNKDYCQSIKVIVAPKVVENLKFVTADEESATITWSPSYGATSYKIEYNGNIYNTTDTQFAIPIDDNVDASDKAYVYAQKKLEESDFIAESAKAEIDKFCRLTKKIGKGDFGLLKKGENPYYFYVNANGHGWEIEGVTTKGKAYKFKAQADAINKKIAIKNIKDNKMYKYHVRPFITNTDGIKVYGNWSDYRYLCHPKKDSIKASSRIYSNKIKLNWKKLTGVSKIKIKVSKKQNSGFKTCTTISGSKKSCTIMRYGKTKLKRNQSYYVRIYYQYKVGKKTYTSDIYGIKRVRVR